MVLESSFRLHREMCPHTLIQGRIRRAGDSGSTSTAKSSREEVDAEVEVDHDEAGYISMSSNP